MDLRDRQERLHRRVPAHAAHERGPVDDDDGPGSSLVARSGAPDAIVDTKLALDNLCGAFGGLSQTHHDILVMREFEDLSYREIGDRLGMSRAGVESTLFRARRRLTEEYEELVSGERCVRVRAILDAPPARAPGVRDQRRMARHISHCQPCRRYARLAGVDLDAVRVPTAARIAALIPLPAFVRRRFDMDDGSALLGHHGASAAQWSKVVAVLDPATISGWPRAIAAAATVAAAGLGAGAAVGERPHFASPAGGAQIAPALGQLRVDRERAPDSTTRSPASPNAAAPSDPTASGSGREPKSRGGTRADDPAPPIVGSTPAGTPGPEQAEHPNAVQTGSGGKGTGEAMPSAAPESSGPAATIAPTVKPVGVPPPTAVADGTGSTVGGVDATVPDTLGDVLSTVQNAIDQGGAAEAGTTDGTVPAVTEPATTGPVSTIVGELLGGAGLGER